MLYNVFCYTQHVLSFSFHLFSTAYYWYRRNWADGQNAMDTLWCLGRAWSIGLSRWSLQRDTWRLVRRSRASIMRPSHSFYCDHTHCLFAMQDRPRLHESPRLPSCGIHLRRLAMIKKRDISPRTIINARDIDFVCWSSDDAELLLVQHITINTINISASNPSSNDSLNRERIARLYDEYSITRPTYTQ